MKTEVSVLLFPNFDSGGKHSVRIFSITFDFDMPASARLNIGSSILDLEEDYGDQITVTFGEPTRVLRYEEEFIDEESWLEAAPLISSTLLKNGFTECSCDDK